MRATQIRCDEYESSGARVRVTARKDHIISTDLKISRKFDGKIMCFPEQDAVFDLHREPPTEMEFAHIDKEISLDIDDLVINKSIDRMTFYPLTSQNHLEMSGRERATLLPYFCDDRLYRNKNFRVVPKVTTTYLDADGNSIDGGEDVDFFYHPTITGRLFVRPETETSPVHDPPQMDDYIESSTFYQSEFYSIGTTYYPNAVLGFVENATSNILTEGAFVVNFLQGGTLRQRLKSIRDLMFMVVP